MTIKMLVSRELLERYVTSVEAHGYGFDGDAEIRAALDQVEPCGPIEIHAGKYTGVTSDGLIIIGMAVDGDSPTVRFFDPREPAIRCSFCDVTGRDGNPWSCHARTVNGELVYRTAACGKHKYLADKLEDATQDPPKMCDCNQGRLPCTCRVIT